MPETKSVEFAESALVDLEGVRAWYAEQGVPEVGVRLVGEVVRLVGEVVRQVERLPEFPESGRIVPEIGLPAVRELIHPPFRIVYRIGATRIWIVRVWRSERLMEMPVPEP